MMSKIHNVKKRQPAILHKENRDNWINSRLDFETIINRSFNIRLKNQIVTSPLKYN